MEGHHRFVVDEHLLLQVNTQRLFLVAQRQRELSAVGLAGTVCHVSSNHKLIIHRIVGLRHCQRHRHVKGTVHSRLSLTFGNLFTVVAVAKGGCLPIAAVRPPPEGSATNHLVLHLSPLHRHTGISHGVTLHRQRVTCGISLLHLRELDMERWALIFFHTDIMILTVHTDGIHARQTR